MKQYIYSLLFILLGIVSLSSCSDNDYAEMNKGFNQLALTANQTDIQLNEQEHASEAVAFSWTSGNNYGTGNRISYTLELAKSGTNFSHPYVEIDSVPQNYSWSVNNEDLNKLLIDSIGAVAGVSTKIDARIIAYVAGQPEVQQSDMTISVTPYVPVTNTLYMLGDATPNGWSADNATELTRTDNGIFTWEGKLTVGSYKFITTKGQFLPSYNNNGKDSLTLRTSDDQPDGKFSIAEEHYYQMKVNLLTGAITCTESSGASPAYSNLYFVGEMTGWSFVKMSVDPLDPFLFRYGHYFSSSEKGDFKFGTTDGSWENMYKATQDKTSYTDQNIELVKGSSPDYKWSLQDNQCGKAYKLCVDIHSGKEKMMMKEFTPYNMIYLVGDATPSGWDLSNATAMTTSSAYVSTWTGHLNAGELKFSCDKQSDWNGAWFMCAQGNDKEPTGNIEKALFIDKSSDYLKAQYGDLSISGIDNKWKITKSGDYTITINQLEETVSIVKQ